VPRVLDYIAGGDLDPTFLATHEMTLNEAPMGYQTVQNQKG
jgi:threonine dehydrogenase-like Zn-dependent dehydrogenase